MLNAQQIQTIKSSGTTGLPSGTSSDSALTPEQYKAWSQPTQKSGGGFLDTLNNIYQGAIVKPSQAAAQAVGGGLKDFGDAFHEVQSAGDKGNTPGQFINKAGGGALDMAGAGVRTIFSALGAPVNIVTGAAGNMPTGDGKNVGDRANDAVNAIANKLSESKTLQGISQIPGIDKHVQSLIDVVTPLIIAHLAAGNAKTNPNSNDSASYIKKISDTTDTLMKDPDMAGKVQLPVAIKSIQNDIKVNAEGGGTSIPAHQLKQIMALDPNSFKSVQDFNTAAQQIVSPSTATGVIASGLDSAATKAADVTRKAGDMLPKASDFRGAGGELKELVSPTPTIDKIIGEVAQGKKSDIPSFQRGLENLNLEKIKTYDDLSKSSTGAIKSLAEKQDAILDQDKTLRKVQSLALQDSVDGKSIAHNYVLDAANQMKELYTKTNDPASLAKINNLLKKLDPIKGSGLTVKEVNQLARDYNTEFGSKAFSTKTGEALTSVNSQAYENTRTGVKNTARNLLPDDESRALDAKMTDLYKVKGLSDKMATKVNTLQQRLQQPSVLQKIGGYTGKALRVTGVGDLISKLIGIDKVPGAQTLNAVELESRLSKNLQKIDAALKEKNNDAFAKDIGDILKEEK